MKQALLDSDTLSYYFKRHPQVVAQFNRYMATHEHVFISRVSIVEILGGLKAKDANRQIENFRSFIAQHKILDTTESSAEISANIFAELWKGGRHSGNYDILIAGTAIENELTLITNNTKDYEHINGLSLDNWAI